MAQPLAARITDVNLDQGQDELSGGNTGIQYRDTIDSMRKSMDATSESEMQAVVSAFDRLDQQVLGIYEATLHRLRGADPALVRKMGNQRLRVLEQEIRERLATVAQTTVREKIKRLLELTGWSQTELAARIGISQATVSLLVNGNHPARPVVEKAIDRELADFQPKTRV